MAKNPVPISYAKLMAMKLFMTKYRRFTDIFGEKDAPKEFVKSLSRNLIESVKNGPVLVKDPFYLRWLEANCKKAALAMRLHNTHDFYYIPFWPERPKLYKYIKKIPTLDGQYECVTEWYTF